MENRKIIAKEYLKSWFLVDLLAIMPFEEKIWVAIFFIFGVLLFSFSIFFLSLQSFFKIKLKWLGPITPIGGTFLIVGWILFLADNL